MIDSSRSKRGAARDNQKDRSQMTKMIVAIVGGVLIFASVMVISLLVTGFMPFPFMYAGVPLALVAGVLSFNASLRVKK